MRKDENIKQLFTKYGQILNPNNVLPEYPRPQLERDSYINLNGLWKYAISKDDIIPSNFTNEILVPFPVQSLLSRVNKELEIDDVLYYKTNFSISKKFIKDIVFLHFGAVDQEATIYLNNHKLTTHIGGFFPFKIDITKYLSSNNELIVKVKDTHNNDYGYGKQSRNPKGMWYTDVTGIYQTVWLESVSKNYVNSIKITPDIDTGVVNIHLIGDFIPNGTITIYDNKNNIIIKRNINVSKLAIKINNPIYWTPENPYLYYFEIELEKDKFKSYFAMRKFSIGEGPYGKCLLLNNKPYFHNGLLDQGYYSDGIYTYANEKQVIDDINTLKEMGFNTLRKHIKIEPLRWYYQCDRLGMIVWQDFINSGDYSFFNMTVKPTIGIMKIDDSKSYKKLGRISEASKVNFEKEALETIDLLYNIPSIGVWTIFNEGWGQFDSKRLYKLFKTKDNTRIYDHASGWFDQGIGDLKSLHIYFKKVKLVNDPRPIALTEFGGYSYQVSGHIFNLNDNYGYKTFNDQISFEQSYISLYENEIIPNIKHGLCAAIYTQVSDVEDETNGILTYDRKVCKLNKDKVRKLNERVKL